MYDIRRLKALRAKARASYYCCLRAASLAAAGPMRCRRGEGNPSIVRVGGVAYAASLVAGRYVFRTSPVMSDRCHEQPA